MDYLKKLEEAMASGHVAFHEYIINFDREKSDTYFLFFEGDDDSSFYMIHMNPRLGSKQARIFVCGGREEVLKAQRMILKDGRGAIRTLFFIDKDHNDIVGRQDSQGLKSVYETCVYSIENFLVLDSVFRRYWTQRLHLSQYDQRLEHYAYRLSSILESFRKRALIITCLILHARGIDGRSPVKMNLNNVNLDKVFKLDWHRNVCYFQQGAGQHILQATNISNVCNISWRALRKIAAKYLHDKHPSTYVRGKYELWLFWKVLRRFTAELSSKDVAKKTGLKRATPTLDLPLNACVESLSPLAPCPESLQIFLDVYLPADLIQQSRSR